LTKFSMLEFEDFYEVVGLVIFAHA